MKGKCGFHLWLDVPNGFNRHAHLIWNARFVNKDLLFCNNIIKGTKGKDLCNIVYNFVVENKIDWSHCVGACIDGVHSMTGYYRG